MRAADLLPSELTRESEKGRAPTASKVSAHERPEGREETEIRNSRWRRCVWHIIFRISLQKANGRRRFLQKTLKRTSKIGGYKLPSRPEFTLGNARNAGYLDSVGRGRYRLNPVGYNLAVHSLPHSPVEVDSPMDELIGRLDQLIADVDESHAAKIKSAEIKNSAIAVAKLLHFRVVAIYCCTRHQEINWPQLTRTGSN